MLLEHCAETPPETHANYRLHRRRRMLKRGRIMAHRNLSTIDCVVRDGTENGARLKVVSQLQVPDEFRLINDTDETSFDCRVIWRNGDEMGVCFTNG